VRFVLCDEDRIVCSIVESLVASCGHEVEGVAHTTSDAYHLIVAARPDAVIVDLSLGYNTDFDVLGVAADVGAKAIVFSLNADATLLSRYAVRPVVVPKPDFVALELAIVELGQATDSMPRQEDRRKQPARALTGLAPSGPSDAGAFFEALNQATDGDALVSIDLPRDVGSATNGAALGAFVVWELRQTDRLLGSESWVRIFLAGAGPDGAGVVLQRLQDNLDLPSGARLRAIVIQPGEGAADAFDRLKHSEDIVRLTV
jgi:hypothetical protein